MNISQKIKILKKTKKTAGLHSPSIKEIVTELGYNPIKHDFCFLSNPYTTNLVVDFFKGYFSKKKSIFNILESYPANYTYAAKRISSFEGLDSRFMVVGNGAIQAIEWVCEGGYKKFTNTYSNLLHIL